MTIEQKNRENAMHRLDQSTCGARTATNSGGYDHWYCQRGRFHVGPHRFNNYTWPRLFGRRVKHNPVDMDQVAS